MKKALMLFLLVVLAFTFIGCEAKSVVPEGFELVWSDEFNVDGAPDPEKWAYATGGHGWGNGEVQHYTKDRKNSYIKHGRLVIKAMKEGYKWTSARLKTQYIKAWTYGYFEIRAKLPEGVGTWPAIWMMPEYDNYGGWPRSGEIDIMEHVGFDQDIIHTTIHTSAFNHKIGTQKARFDTIKDVSKKYHTYAVNWTPDYIEWFIDGESFFKFENTGNGVEEWPYNHPFHLILNVAIGGSWGGQKGIDEDMKEAAMEVDYVRVYQQKK